MTLRTRASSSKTKSKKPKKIIEKKKKTERLGRTDKEQVQAEYILDLDKVEKGLETRTTLMVRNIPNKYTQQMLLEEINTHFKVTQFF